MTAVLSEPAGTTWNHTWVAVCAESDLVPERPVAALVGGEQVAVVRTHDGQVHAVGNRDPFSGAYVLSRGIVGSAGEVPVLISPMFKQAFDLRTGQCLGTPGVAVPTYAVNCDGGVVSVALGDRR
ncbi:nitrite reductase small subunit NirD [Actinopolymorpha sp. NPDC004070]|uniref:nitrite reductase small subunit NirD n=1 Tax=Actinopolymorpha sp. NPDC004070 TaxID=3154548 RepID=UPI0033B48815